MNDYPGYYGFFPRPQGEFPMNVPTREYRTARRFVGDAMREKLEESMDRVHKDREELERLRKENERLRRERDILFEYAVKDMMLICGPHWADREKSEARVRELIAEEIERRSTSGIETVSMPGDNSTQKH
jgi:hypothetical protein